MAVSEHGEPRRGRRAQDGPHRGPRAPRRATGRAARDARRPSSGCAPWALDRAPGRAKGRAPAAEPGPHRTALPRSRCATEPRPRAHRRARAARPPAMRDGRVTREGFDRRRGRLEYTWNRHLHEQGKDRSGGSHGAVGE
jgi:hypothetical protein